MQRTQPTRTASSNESRELHDLLDEVEAHAEDILLEADILRDRLVRRPRAETYRQVRAFAERELPRDRG